VNEDDVTLSPLPQAAGRMTNGPTIALRHMPGFGDWLVCGISTQLHQEILVSMIRSWRTRMTTPPAV
jgi:mRNA interferase MazF